MPLTLSSPAFVAGGDIPRTFTCDGEDVSPHLTWIGAPAGVRSFALIVDDPDAPRGTFTHWVLYDIPADRTEIPPGPRAEGIGVAGRNSRGDIGYMGPCPPSGTHRYFFRLYALDVDTLGLTPGAARSAVERAMKGHIIAQAELMGRYRRGRT